MTGGPEMQLVHCRYFCDIQLKLDELTVDIQLHIPACFFTRSAAHNARVDALIPTGLYILNDKLPALMH